MCAVPILLSMDTIYKNELCLSILFMCDKNVDTKQISKIVYLFYNQVITVLIKYLEMKLFLSKFRNTLVYAIRWDSKDMVNLLLDEGIDFFFKDVFGWTALRYAIEGTSKG